MAKKEERGERGRLTKTERHSERQRERETETKTGSVEGMLRPKLKLSQCHFGYILLAEGSYRSVRFKERGNMVGEMAR